MPTLSRRFFSKLAYSTFFSSSMVSVRMRKNSCASCCPEPCMIRLRFLEALLLELEFMRLCTRLFVRRTEERGEAVLRVRKSV